MRRFWDRRAREDAFYFIDSRLRYRDPDLDEFWAGGEAVLLNLERVLGVAVEPADTVVEIGCGVGRITRALATRAERVLALDVSAVMLERARGLNPALDNVDWLHGDGTSLAGVEDGCAQACVSQVVLQHIPDPAVTLGYVREIGRVLADGGWAAVQVSNDPAMHRPRGDLRARLQALVGRSPRGQRNPAWLGSAVELEDVHRAAAEGGLAVETIWGPGTQFCQVALRRLGPAPSRAGR